MTNTLFFKFKCHFLRKWGRVSESTIEFNFFPQYYCYIGYEISLYKFWCAQVTPVGRIKKSKRSMYLWNILCLFFQGLSNDPKNVKISIQNYFCVFVNLVKIFKKTLLILLFLASLDSPWKNRHKIFHKYMQKYLKWHFI